MKRIWSQCVKELAQFRRDRLTFALAFILPLGMLLIFGYAIRLETKNIPLAIQDFDASPLSRSYVERLFATNQFQPIAWSGEGDAIAIIDQGLAKATVVIPPDFSRRIKDQKASSIQVLVDGTDVNNARVIRNSIRATTNFFLQSQGLRPRTANVVARIRLWFNPGRKESLFIVPGLYAVILAIFPALLSTLAMVREKEQGTIVQVYASNLSATELLLGKGLAYFIVSIGEALCIMGLGSLLFRIEFAGNPLPFLLGTGLFAAASVLYGLFIGGRANNRIAAVQGVAFTGFLASFLFSGFIYPLSNIPFPISLISNIVPARYYIDVTRDAFVRGTGWGSVWVALIAISLLALLFFAAAWRGLRRMQLSD
ncbi:MAG: ABC transporter permease [Leptolyngbya sp. SIO1E4]|nr:ABC transporter permease [Leptolyngbya sp. SIO1E4]